jgi:hypothetical protein
MSRDLRGGLADVLRLLLPGCYRTGVMPIPPHGRLKSCGKLQSGNPARNAARPAAVKTCRWERFTYPPTRGTGFDRDDDSGKDPGHRNDGIMQTKEERRGELKQLAATPNGIDKVYAILTRNFIPFQKLPIGTLMIEAILDHEYPEKR